jgi:uncharacterized protein with PIN domain
MKVERAGDLMFVTYYMVRWDEELQFSSREACAGCRNQMKRIEAEVGEKGLGYDGLVCHNCKRIVWVRNG